MLRTYLARSDKRRRKDRCESQNTKTCQHREGASSTNQQKPAKEPQCKEHDAEQRFVIGLDPSDRTAQYAVLGPAGED